MVFAQPWLSGGVTRRTTDVRETACVGSTDAPGHSTLPGATSEEQRSSVPSPLSPAPGLAPESFDAVVQAVGHFHQPALPVAFHEGRAIHLGPRGRGEDHPLPNRAGRPYELL